jgi:serine O-acetyltransferase
MIISLTKTELTEYVCLQVKHLFPDPHPPGHEIASFMNLTLERVEHCFSAVHNKYFKRGKDTIFNHLNTDQYAMFLYILSNTLYRNDADPRLCEKLFYLNKALNGIDVFFSVDLPDIFLFTHPIGTVLGRAQYSDYFHVYQNCTIGSSHAINDHPTMGRYTALYKGSAILGRCMIGDNCKIAAESLLMDMDLSNNSIYIGNPEAFSIKPCRYHDRIWDSDTYFNHVDPCAPNE